MDKKSFIGFLLIALVIIFLPKYYQLVDPNYGKTDSLSTAAQEISAPETETTIVTQEEPQNIFKNEETNIQLTTQDEVSAEDYQIETDLFIATLSNKAGGTFKSFKLKDHTIITENDTSLVDIINHNSDLNLYLQFRDVNHGQLVKITNNFTLKNQSGNSFKIKGNNDLILKFSSTYEGKVISKTFTFYGDKYYFNLTNDLTKIADQLAADSYNIVWDGGVSYTEKDINDENRYSIAYAHTNPDETENFKIKNEKTEASEFNGITNWTAIRSKYFTVAMLPKRSALGYKLTGYGISTKLPNVKRETILKYFGMELVLPKDTPTEMTVYMGPLSKNLLNDVNDKLDNIMTFGAAIIRPISKGVLWLFTYLYKFIPNYGFVLILFSILVKLILHPLTIKSTQSMKEMHKLQPMINELKEKYPNDPQKLNQATMKLYQEHGVNPMGGCLPVLLQMPILFALFTVFRTTIELRHAPFILWITDLSTPDHMLHLPFNIPFYGEWFNLLPLLMVGAQILMQTMSGQTQTAQQKQMAYMMPIMFFFLFNNFPSGLVLYYTLFNVLTVLQQQYFTPDAKPKEKKAKQRKSRLERMRELQQRRKNFK